MKQSLHLFILLRQYLKKACSHCLSWLRIGWSKIKVYNHLVCKMLYYGLQQAGLDLVDSNSTSNTDLLVPFSRIEWSTSENYNFFPVYDVSGTIRRVQYNFFCIEFYQATMAILVTQCKAKAWEKASILLIFDQLRLSFQTAILCSRIGGLEITLGWVTEGQLTRDIFPCL